MKLSVLYRTHPGANSKVRPPWFSRPLAWHSLQASLAQADVATDLTVVADGGLPEELSEVVAVARVPVRRISGGTAASSFRGCVAVALDQARADPPDTLYWFAEDDYLYRPGAMNALAAAVRQLRDVDYFALYTCNCDEWFATHPSQPTLDVPELPSGRPVIDGVAWRRIRGTTSTFGVTRNALLSDAGLLRLASRAGSPFDAATWHALQGQPPYDWSHLFSDLDGYWRPRGVAKVLIKPPMRAVVNLAARRPPERRRVLVAPVVDLAMHLEADMIPEGQGWDPAETLGTPATYGG